MTNISYMNCLVDINVDIGEGMPNEAELMPWVSSCNIACGGHAGDLMTLQNSIELAVAHGVRIGAHPSYPDRKRFGRSPMDISIEELESAISHQLMDFKIGLKSTGAALHHVKAHGALYHRLAQDPVVAYVYLRKVEEIMGHCIIYAPPRSVLYEMAKNEGFEVWAEGFLDRRYHRDLSLVSRGSSEAILSSPEEVLQQLLSMIRDQKVANIEGDFTPISARTFCIHGDHPMSVQILQHIVQAASKHEIVIQ